MMGPAGAILRPFHLGKIRANTWIIAIPARFVAARLAEIRGWLRLWQVRLGYDGRVMVRINRELAILPVLTALLLMAGPGQAAATDDLDQSFDAALGAGAPHQAPAHEPVATYAAPLSAPAAGYETRLGAELAALAEPHHGRIGVAATDLSTGRSVAVLGEQPFPLASTGKVAIVATYLDMVDQGRLSLSSAYPLLIPVPSAPFSSPSAPERPGATLSAVQLIELALTRSDNHATDALLAAIGGPGAVDHWLRKVGVSGMRLDRNIGTLVRDDGEVNPATTIDVRDSTTPQAMVSLLSGLYQGQWLSPASREVLLGAMGRCITGKLRMHAALPSEALIGHKTGTLNNTASDVGFIRTPDGHTLAVAIYVTGQGSEATRAARIASITRAIYQGYQNAEGDGGAYASRSASR